MNFRTVELSDPRFEQHGIRHMTVKSPALGRRGDISFFIPGSEMDGPCCRLLILLNGVYNSHWGWIYHAGIHYIAQRLIDSGRIEPLIIAMPSDGLWGDGSAYISHDREDCERWIMAEVPEAAQLATSRLSIAPTLFLAGLSMGGFGALRLGAKYAERVAAVSAHSAITHISQMQQFVEEPAKEYQSCEMDDLSITYWLKKNSKALPRIRFDCGVEDELLLANRRLHEELEELSIGHSYYEFAGGHNWRYWEQHVIDTLVFFNGGC